jgi:protein kinase-like protein
MMPQPSKRPVARSGAARSVDQLPAVQLADLLLLGAVRWNAGSLVLEPMGDQQALMLEKGVARLVGTVLPLSLGDAVAARIAILAGLDITVPGDKIGKLQVAHRGGRAEFLVGLRPTGRGLALEVRRIAERVDGHRSTAVSIGLPMVIGDYVLQHEIGHGGMGVVYRAEHRLLRKPVAVKVLGAAYAHDPEWNARLLREARAASRVRHPGIVDVTDFLRHPDGRACIVMELIQGRTLDQEIEQGALAPARAVDIARQIALALRAAHEHGVIHHDLKPSNVFLEEGDRVKVVDFGAARVLGNWQGVPGDAFERIVVGTPWYMSPEQAKGLPTDVRTDIYTLGCVLFEMLSGRVPFEADTPYLVISKHVSAPVPTVHSPMGPLPEILERCVARALAKRVEERHQSAAELLIDLDRIADGLLRLGWRRLMPLS